MTSTSPDNSNLLPFLYKKQILKAAMKGNFDYKRNLPCTFKTPIIFEQPKKAIDILKEVFYLSKKEVYFIEV
jgi:hypothetical protein